MAQFNLIVQTAFIGDLVLTIPLMKNLKSRFPQTPLVLLCRQGLGEFFRQKKLVDEVFEVGKKPVSNWSDVKKNLKTRDFKFIICPHQSLRSALFVRNLRAERKIGYKKWWNFFAFHQRYQRPMEMPEVLRQMILIKDLDRELNVDFEKARTLTWFDPQTSPNIPERFSLQIEPSPSQREKTVFLAPGSEWPTKRWTPEGFISVGKYYSERGFKVFVTGAPSEKSHNAQVAAAIPGAQDITGKTTIAELYEKFRRGILLVTNDNGASHIASSAGLPVVSVFGPTVPEFGYRPWQDAARIAQIEISCRPCSAHGQAQCPIGTHDCMKKLTSEDVIQKAKEMIP